MGALGHFLETNGIPTTQISLIREHTEIIQPPRALWVPFELGRPLGNPLDAGLQRRVLLAALDLFRAHQGPVLADFAYETTVTENRDDPESMPESCPVSFASPAKDTDDDENRIAVFRREAAELRNWYDIGLEKTGRTSMVGFDPDAAVRLISDYAANGITVSLPEKPDIPFAVALRLAVQDLKTFYFEAFLARPGVTPMDGDHFKRWFWRETAAGRVVKSIRKRCLDETDPSLQMTGKMFLVPMDQG